MSIASCTIISKRYLAFARVLTASFRRWCPGIPLFVLLADEVDGFFEPGQESFQLLHLGRLPIAHLQSFCFRHTSRELLSAVKPYLLNYLLQSGFSSVVYLDADVLVLNDLTPLLERVVRHAITVTPHITFPLRTKHAVGQELNLLQSGVYNAGFVGVSDRTASRQFLLWWQARVAECCVSAVAEGLFFDQKWLDFAPSFIEDIEIIRDSAYNAAYWNLSQRDLRFDGGSVTVDGRPGGFFHFSGFDPRSPERITRYWPREVVAHAEPAVELFHHYAALLREADSQTSLNWPCAYDGFDNGVPIPDLARQIYKGLPDPDRQFGDPFRTSSPGSYYRWLNCPVDDHPDAIQTVTRLWKMVYERRPDVSAAYPDWLGSDREAFLKWAEQNGAREHSIAAALLPAQARIQAPLHRTPQRS